MSSRSPCMCRLSAFTCDSAAFPISLAAPPPGGLGGRGPRSHLRALGSTTASTTGCTASSVCAKRHGRTVGRTGDRRRRPDRHRHLPPRRGGHRPPVSGQKQLRPGQRLAAATAGRGQGRSPSAKEEKLQIAGHAVSFVSSPDNAIRSFYVADGDFHFVTTSRKLVEWFLATGAAEHESLGALSSVSSLARTNLPLARNDTVFAYFSPAFFHNLLDCALPGRARPPLAFGRRDRAVPDRPTGRPCRAKAIRQRRRAW